MAKGTFLGVYASYSNKTATNTKKALKHYWFVWEDSNGYLVQLLDNAYQPIAEPQTLPLEIFKKNFINQPHILAAPITSLHPSSKNDTEKTITKYDKQHKTTPNTSQVTKNNFNLKKDMIIEQSEQAKHIDTKLRSEFTTALERWHSGDKLAPLKTFEGLSNIQEGIVPEHKHMFTDFGVNLRKNSLPKLAILHFKRAVELSPEDAHAHFNLARVYYELGNLNEAEQHLERALSISPDFNVATKFLGLIHDQKKYS